MNYPDIQIEMVAEGDLIQFIGNFKFAHEKTRK